MVDIAAGHELSISLIRLVKLLHVIKSHAPTIKDGLEHAAVPYLSELTKGDCRISELAEKTFTEVSVVSRQVRQLEQRGLVEKWRDPHDGRAFTVHLTPHGKQLVATLYEERAKWLQQLVSEWSGTDVAELTRLLNKLSGTFAATIRGDYGIAVDDVMNKEGHHTV